MNKNILMVMFCIILLAGSVSAGSLLTEFDNVKNYEEETKTYDIRNSILGIPFLQLSKIAEVELLSDEYVIIHNYDEPVMVWGIYNYKDYSGFLKEMDSFLNDTNGDRINTKYKYKYFNEKIKTHREWKVGNKTYPGNQTIYEYNYLEEMPGSWVWFDETKELPEGYVKIAVYLDSQIPINQNIELIPTLFGVKLKEWAVYSLSEHYDVNDNTWADLHSVGTAGQIFTPQIDEELGKIEVLIYSQNAEGTLFGFIRNTTTGTSSGEPNGSIIATFTNVTQGTIPDGAGAVAWYNLTFNGGNAFVNENSSYSIWLKGDSATGVYSWRQDSVGATYTYGTKWVRGAGSWLQSAGSDFMFRTWNTSITPDSPPQFSGWDLVNNSNYTTNNINANATWWDDILLNNVSVFVDGTLNQTNNTGQNNTLYDFDLVIPEGTHLIYLEGYDNITQINTTGVRYVNIDTLDPIVTIVYPGNTTYITDHTTSKNFSFNLESTATDLFLDACWIDYLNGTNSTITCNVNKTLTGVTWGTHTYRIWANDSFGKRGSADITATWNYTVLENSQEFINETLEGVTNTFTANITITKSNSVTIANLIYNGTSNIGSFSQSENDTILTIDLLAPDVKTNTNLTFYWSLLLADSQIINLTSYNQTVTPITIDNCSTNTVVLYNYTIVDEGNQSRLTNTTAELNINLLDSQGQINVFNYSLKYININPFGVCINQNLLSSTYIVTSVIKYEADGYAIEYYNIVDAIITNETIPENITLYDLFSGDSTEFKITFKAEDFTFVEDALIYIDRQYISENNTFKTVELPKTDSNGQTVGHFVRNDVVYNIRVIKNGEVLGNFRNVIAFCEDFLVGNCQMVLEATSEDFVTFDYDETLGIIFQSLPTYDANTSSISFAFSTDDGSIKTVLMDVTRDDIFGNRTLCNNTVVSSGGTLMCSFSPSIDDSTLRVGVFVDGQQVMFSNVTLEPSGYGNLGYVLWFFLTFLFILLFGHSKTEVLIGLAISFIGAISLGITRGDLIGLGSAGIWVLVIIILGIWKLNKEKPQ